MTRFTNRFRPLASALTLAAAGLASNAVAQGGGSAEDLEDVRYKTTEIDGLEIFYREAGDPANPAIVLLHGFPTSSHMYRDLIPELSEDFYVVAPDFPGFGFSDAPPHNEWDYTFHNISMVVEEFIEERGIDSASLYVMDYGAPVGYRIFERNPELVDAFIIQNGNAYEEGLREFWDPIKAYWADPSDENREALAFLITKEATIWQYTTGVRNVENISPDTWDHVQPLLDRPQSKDIPLDLFLDYGTNVPRYETWQAMFREHQPRALILWGANDPIFPAEGAGPYTRDLIDVELHMLDTGHFALEEDADVIAEEIIYFLTESDD